MSLNIELSNKANEVWENHMKSFCSGRESAFELSSELIFSLADNNNINILDIACGYGGWSKFLQNKFSENKINVNFTGMDYSEERLLVYKDNLGSLSKHIKGDILETLKEVEHNSFDTVIMGWASHEIPKDQLSQIYKLILNCLKPKGFFFMADFVKVNNPDIENLCNILTKKKREEILNDPIKLDNETWLKSLNNHNHHKAHKNHDSHNHKHNHRNDFLVSEHLELLNNSEFTITKEIWKSMNSSMILAIK